MPAAATSSTADGFVPDTHDDGFTPDVSASTPAPTPSPAVTGHPQARAPQPNGGDGFVPDNAPAVVPGAPKTEKATPLEKVFAPLDSLFILANALYRGGHGYTNTAELKKAVDLLRGGHFVEANRKYGIGTPEELKDEAAHGDAFSAFLQGHPTAAGIATAGAEFGNPLNYVLGPVLGGVARVPGIKQGLGFLGEHLGQTFNLFHEVKKVAGPEGEAAVRNLLNSRNKAEEEAFDLGRQIFGPDLTLAQKREIQRLSQNLPRNAAVPEPKGFPLEQRAKMAREALQRLDTLQKEHEGLLPSGRTYDPTTYFPMKGAYVDPRYDVEALEEAGLQKGGVGSGRLGVRPGTTAWYAKKIFPNLDEATASGKLRPDYDPAQNFTQHYAERLGNVNFETAAKKLPETLRRNWEDELAKQFPGPHGGVPSEDFLRELKSPTFAKSVVDPSLVKVLQKQMNAAKVATSDQQGLLKYLDSWNRITRIGIISNPVVHVGWNLLNNFLAAGGDLRDLGSISKEIDAAADEAGAHFSHGAPRAVFGATKPAQGSSALQKSVHLLTSHPSELPLAQKADRVATQVWTANQKLVFNKAERAFANALYKKYTTTGRMAPGEAAIAVRKALGDFSNTDAKMNRVFFFYPWLKTIIPFWAKVGVTKPQFINAPREGIRTHNALAGDPNVYGTQHSNPTADFTAYLGKDKQGNLGYASLPFPQRIAADIVNPLGGPNQGVMKVASSHLTPALSVMEDYLITQFSPAHEPGGGDFHTIYNKNAPGKPYNPLTPQGQEAAGYLAGKLPFAGQVENLRNIVQATTTIGPQAAVGLAGGWEYERLPQTRQRALYRVQTRYARLMGSARKRGDEQRVERLWKQYQAERKRIVGDIR